MSGNDLTSSLDAARFCPVDITVWVDSWQMQCCGQPFRIGSHVAWTLRAADPDWLEAMLGTDAQQAVDAAEEHHGGIPEDTEPTRGRVTRIAAVHCRFAPMPGSDSPTAYPVQGTGILTDVESADGWTDDSGDEHFVGYLVQLQA
jgi:hypothetical protein